MKMRLMGPADLVRAWAQAVQKYWNIGGREYPSRYGDDEVRVYIDIDDREAERIVQRTMKANDDVAEQPRRLKRKRS